MPENLKEGCLIVTCLCVKSHSLVPSESTEVNWWQCYSVFSGLLLSVYIPLHTTLNTHHKYNPWLA